MDIDIWVLFGTLYLMMQRVEVLAKFEKGSVFPVKFFIGMREVEVQKINLVYQRKDGGKKFLCFAVSTLGFETELRFDRDNLTWTAFV